MAERRAYVTAKGASMLLLAAGGRLAQRHPYSWKLAWEAVHKLPFLLPHDKSYNAFRHFIKATPTGLYLDIGANDGVSALSFRKFSRDYRILSLEPNRLLEPSLRRLKSRDARFDYRMVGAGSAPGRVRFFMPVYRGIALHTFTSASREHVERALVEQFGSNVARRARIEAIDGEVVRLDDLGLAPTIVKIDAEGFDDDVMEGMTATVDLARPFIAAEIAWANQGRIADMLRRYDYTLADYDIAADRFVKGSAGSRSSMPAHRNLFAIPRDKESLLPFAGGTERPW
jgi:FkbM family methyltransferase